MRCEEIMKKQVSCVGPSDNVKAAAQKMRDNELGFLPVCDDSKNVLGVITDRDITIRLVASDESASSTKVDSIMSKELVACRPEDDIDTAQKLMKEHKKSRIMCVDDDGKLVGVISLSDIAQCEEPGRASETLKHVSSREASAPAFS